MVACAGKTRKNRAAEPAESGAAGDGAGVAGERASAGDGGRGGASGGSAGSGGRGGGSSGTGGTSLGGTGGTGGAGAVAGSGTSGGGSGAVAVVCDGVVCDALPHVRDGAAVECRDGLCVIPPDGCEAPFADCVSDATSGCETDLRDEASCGACDVQCDAAAPICTVIDGAWACGTACIPSTPTFCGRCVDLTNDVRACGSCDNDCTRAHAAVDCVNGTCELLSTECDIGYGDCNDEFGCESSLAEASNCGSCGRDCRLPHTVADCSRADACGAPRCEPGFANCSHDSADCETPFGEGCAPVLSGVTALSGDVSIRAVAYGAEGSYVIGGAFYDTQDLDPGPGVEEHVAPLGQAAFVSWYSASGDYAGSISFGADLQANVDELVSTDDGGFLMLGIDDDGKFVAKLTPERDITWIRHFDPNANVTTLAAGVGGAAIVAGGLHGSADLDPGPGEAVVINDRVVVDNAFVVTLDADGLFVRATPIADLMLESPCSVDVGALSVAPDGRLFVAGFASGFCTLDGEPFDGVYINSYDAAGTRVARVSAGISDLQAAVLRADGSFEAAGTLRYRTDFDPGAGVLELTNQDETSDGYLLGLDSAHDFRRVNAFPDTVPTMIAPFSDGAVLTVLGVDEVHTLDVEGTDLFAFRVGSGFSAIAASDTEFLLAGEVFEATDLDPGPVEATVSAGTFVARYRRSSSR